MSDDPALRAIGYSPRWQALFEPLIARGLTPARVIRSDRGSALVATADGIVRAKTSADLMKSGEGMSAQPAVGDWVALLTPDEISDPVVEAVVERASTITRGDPAGTSDVQVLAANIDTVFVVQPIDDPPNLRRIERELSMAWDSGAAPVVVLTKADLSPDAAAARALVEEVALGSDVFVTNSLTGEGIDSILDYISDHRTAVLIGPSGAGKSTLINALLGEERQATAEVRVSDRKGRHTTVARELVQMPSGGVLIDTPGLRALAVTGSEEGIASVFPDIELAAEQCRFRDCTHNDEPGCAVRAAVEAGELPTERLASYHKLLGEAQVAVARTDARLRSEGERDAKILSKVRRTYNKQRDRE